MILTKDLSVHYRAAIAIRDVSLSVPIGQMAAIVGPSGSGKSSFLAALNRMTDLIPGARVSGQILIDGENVHGPNGSAAELRRRVGMVFQKPNPFPMSIERNIQLALREHGVRRRHELQAITEQVLQDVGLWDEVKGRLRSSALQLSGGQQQRLCLARALALQPQVLLMDEPCSALDPMATAKIDALINQLRGRYTIVMATHNLAQARRLADQLAVFWVRNGAGELIAYGPTDSVFARPTDPVAAAFLAAESASRH